MGLAAPGTLLTTPPSLMPGHTQDLLVAVAEGLFLFTLVAGIAGMDLAKTHPMTAGGVMLGAVHALIQAGATTLGMADAEALWWVAAIMLPAAFWAMASDVIVRTRSELGIHVGLWVFQTLWFGLAVVLMSAAGGRPSLWLAVGLSLVYGAPLLVGLWAATPGRPLDRIERRWQVLVLILASAMLMAMLAALPDVGYVLVFFLLAIVWGTVRYGKALDFSQPGDVVLAEPGDVVGPQE